MTKDLKLEAMNIVTLFGKDNTRKENVDPVLAVLTRVVAEDRRERPVSVLCCNCGKPGNNEVHGGFMTAAEDVERERRAAQPTAADALKAVMELCKSKDLDDALFVHRGCLDLISGRRDTEAAKRIIAEGV